MGSPGEGREGLANLSLPLDEEESSKPDFSNPGDFK
jgi:hypothetical protein